VVFWTCEVTNSSANKKTDVLINVNDVTTLNELGHYNPALNYYMTEAGFCEISLTQGVEYTFRLKYRVSTGSSGTAKIRRARLLIVRRT
jgi:glutamine cyclotransferase